MKTERKFGSAASITDWLFKKSIAAFLRIVPLQVVRGALLAGIALVVQPLATNSRASAQSLPQENLQILQGNGHSAPDPNRFDYCYSKEPGHEGEVVTCPDNYKTIDFTVMQSHEVFAVYDLGQSHGCCDDHKSGELRISLTRRGSTELLKESFDAVPFQFLSCVAGSPYYDEFDFFWFPGVAKGLERPVGRWTPCFGPPLNNYETNKVSLGVLDPGDYTAELQVADAGWNQLFRIVMLGDDFTRTPIKHLVVIFDENISFDHYFGTYPSAKQSQDEPDQRFPMLNTPTPCINNLLASPCFGNEDINNNTNPNYTNPGNGSDAAYPFRLSRGQALTRDMTHDYDKEQLAFDGGKMDLFPLWTGTIKDTKSTDPRDRLPAAIPETPSNGNGTKFTDTKGLVMGYYDGNTVTALWNYALHYALNDNSYGTTFGPSTVGALNLISGQTNGVEQNSENRCPDLTIDDGQIRNDGKSRCTVYNDPDPINDMCGKKTVQMSSANINIGHLLNAANVSWGWFQGGFSSASCTSEYSPHHNPFQYYESTSNRDHTAPDDISEIGFNGPANHQYDIGGAGDPPGWIEALEKNHLPAVSFLKAPVSQDAHPKNSTPSDEQTWLVSLINRLQASPFWSSTAVVIAYDDSDGWYDHQMSPIVNLSNSTLDYLLTPRKNPADKGACDSVDPQTPANDKDPNVPPRNNLVKLPGPGSNGNGVDGRCGYGPRLPLLVISPWAKANYVDHTLTDQTSILRFIEDNWLGGLRIGQGSFDVRAGTIENMFDFTGAQPKNTKLLLDPNTGQPM